MNIKDCRVVRRMDIGCCAVQRSSRGSYYREVGFSKELGSTQL